MAISHYRLLFLILSAHYPCTTFSMESNTNTLNLKRFIYGLCATTVGTLSLYDQIHNEKYSWKRSLFTGSCFLTGFISLFGKYKATGFQVGSPTVTSFSRSEMSFRQGDHWVTFVTHEGDQPSESQEDIFEKPFDLTSINTLTEHYLQDRRPQRPTRPRRPHAPTPPTPPIEPTVVNPFPSRVSRRNAYTSQITMPTQISFSCTLF